MSRRQALAYLPKLIGLPYENPVVGALIGIVASCVLAVVGTNTGKEGGRSDVVTPRIQLAAAHR